ncbi:hypothetical protein [Actibacterium sp. XHP0104]|uniref:hypothetical protein n=1 Tax=Actibacterium sp. XHP0104 TaxID=2984335 RepID=UPI0021E88F6C|nr:hypothetical protein [Actibacterium sp. XHP0104]MCV2881808.1 hypothetical protein [Actibacterium sp. XHP0104]
MADDRRIAALGQMGDMIRDMALAELRQAAQRRGAAESAIGDLDAQRRRVVPDLDDAASMVGADLAWHRWADARRAELNIELATCRAAENRSKTHAARAFGRAEALQRIISRMRG